MAAREGGRHGGLPLRLTGKRRHYRFVCQSGAYSKMTRMALHHGAGTAGSTRSSRAPWYTMLSAFLLAAFAIVNLGNALYKGGDFDVFLDAGQRVIDAEPLYDDSATGHGFIGPPFQAVFFVPNAWLAGYSLSAAKVSWYLLNLAALLAGAWLWTWAISGRPAGTLVRWPSPVLPWALLAIVLPAQTNFEHQNMNALLLGLTGGAVWALRRRHTGLAGVALGLAAALKAFPALLIVYLAARREWKAAITGVVVTTALTMGVAIRYGLTETGVLLWQWLQINDDGGWPERVQNQSLYAMAERFIDGSGMWLYPLVATALVTIVLWVAIRRHQAPLSSIGGELAFVLAAAVLLSPIAWDHYWVLMLPAFLVAGCRGGIAGWGVFIAAALLVSGPSPVLPGGAFNLFRAWSAGTVAGLLLVVASAWWLAGKGTVTRAGP